jgi:serine protease AprX
MGLTMVYGREVGRRKVGAVLAGAALLLGAAGLPHAGTSARSAGSDQLITVIVQEVPGAAAQAIQAVRDAGGTVEREMGIIPAFTAKVRQSRVANLQHAPGVAAVTPDRSVHLNGKKWDSADSNAANVADYNPLLDPGSLYNTTIVTGARDFWASGYTGKGVDIAMIDSGVVPAAGLDSAGKIVYGPDLSFDAPNATLQNLDSFGHGTHMSSIAAGKDPGAVAGTYATDTTHFLGMAPDSRLVSVKVADTGGATDVSQVIAAIDWVVQHKNDTGMNIRVLNLSFGTDTKVGYENDPLAFAAEAAWDHGIVVVASVGNAGHVDPKNKGKGSAADITDPAYDPNILAVGAADTKGTETFKDDTVADFSSSGSGAHGRKWVGRNPDVVAPGLRIEGLNATGSMISQMFPKAVVNRIIRGSGSSQATAITSGAAALILSAHPDATPDQVKQLLMASADQLPLADTALQGSGEINLTRALGMATDDHFGPGYKSPTKNHKFDAADGEGGGSLEGSRGSYHVDDNGVNLTGEKDIFGAAFNSELHAQQEVNGTAWNGGVWNGNIWSGSGFSGGKWKAAAWVAKAFSGSRWSGSRWSGGRWSGGRWSGSRWSGGRWSGSRWSGDAWDG